MKKIFVNLKRFDIPQEKNGISAVKNIFDYGYEIVSELEKGISKENNLDSVTIFFPEAHIISAIKTKKSNSIIKIGCQSVFRDDVAKGGNFGAFTTNRTASSAVALGCECTIIGHCEERKDKMEIMLEAGVKNETAVSRILNKEVKAAINAGLDVLFCIGETTEEQPRQAEVLEAQLKEGLAGVDLSKVVIGYEPIWAIGPGKTPPQREYIEKTAKLIKSIVQCPVVYGGGLKKDNARMLYSIDEIDGGLIALTRFSGNIGFYPNECIEIINTYIRK